MKKIISLVILHLIGCSQSDSAQNGDIGQGGSLAVFAIKETIYGVDQMKLNVFSLIDSKSKVKKFYRFRY
jgi:hypothetical protein